MLPDADHQMLTGALRLESETVASVMFNLDEAVSVSHDATARDVEIVCQQSGHSRVFVRDSSEAVVGLVHVRDAMRSTSRGHAKTAVTEFAQDPTWLSPDLHLIDAVAQMSQERAQLAMVGDRKGSLRGLVSLEDILEQILGEFNDETDT